MTKPVSGKSSSMISATEAQGKPSAIKPDSVRHVSKTVGELLKKMEPLGKLLSTLHVGAMSSQVSAKGLAALRKSLSKGS